MAETEFLPMSIFKSWAYSPVRDIAIWRNACSVMWLSAIIEIHIPNTVGAQESE